MEILRDTDTIMSATHLPYQVYHIKHSSMEPIFTVAMVTKELLFLFVIFYVTIGYPLKVLFLMTATSNFFLRCFPHGSILLLISTS